VNSDPSTCHFALIGDPRSLPALDRFAFGSNEYPDRSTTLILQVESLTQGPTLELRGPGIDGSALLQASIHPADLFERLAINAALFPRGIDVVLVHDDSIVAIPRTTRLAAQGD
jgi:alpha-D-ribose 1-methylphosphonate 5-triphosphate synthase subunit PhnH